MNRIKTIETRNALPYVSQFTITKIPTQKWVPTGRTDGQGNELYLSDYDRPGIVVEITTYMGSVKGPARPYVFPLKAFYEDIIADLQKDVTERDTLAALEQRTTEQNTRLQQLNQLITSQKVVEKIAEVQRLIDDTNTIWAENVLLAAGIPNFDDFWDNVVSDGLDLLPSWSEANNPSGGIPIYMKEMQIKATIPYEGNKIVNMKMGAFLDPEEVMNPVVYDLVFEDTASKNAREARLAEYIELRTQRQETLASTPEEETEQRKQLQTEIENYTRQIDELEALEIGLLSDLLATPAILESLPVFLMAMIGVLKAKYWPTLDMAEVQAKLQQNLQEMLTVLNVPSATTNSGSKSNS